MSLVLLVLVVGVVLGLRIINAGFPVADGGWRDRGKERGGNRQTPKPGSFVGRNPAAQCAGGCRLELRDLIYLVKHWK